MLIHRMPGLYDYKIQDIEMVTLWEVLGLLFLGANSFLLPCLYFKTTRQFLDNTLAKYFLLLAKIIAFSNPGTVCSETVLIAPMNFRNGINYFCMIFFYVFLG